MVLMMRSIMFCHTRFVSIPCFFMYPHNAFRPLQITGIIRDVHRRGLLLSQYVVFTLYLCSSGSVAQNISNILSLINNTKYQRLTPSFCRIYHFFCMQDLPLVSLAELLVTVRLILIVVFVDAIVGEVHVLVRQALHGIRVPAECNPTTQ